MRGSRALHAWIRTSVALLVLAVGPAAAGDARPQCEGCGWRWLGKGKAVGISGMVHVTRDRYVVVHDAKDAGGKAPRASWLTQSPEGRAALATIAWPWDDAKLFDAEAIARVPGSDDRYLVVGKDEAGKEHRLHHVRIAGDVATWLWSGPLPGLGAGADVEGFALRSLCGGTVAVWADRGGSKTAFRPAVLYAGAATIDPAGPVTLAASFSAPVTAPYPAPTDGAVRGISDLAIDGTGWVWASSASDPGDDGPFASALYAVGRLRSQGAAWTLDACPSLQARATFPCKVEAIDLVPGAANRFALGTDDEDHGGSARFP